VPGHSKILINFISSWANSLYNDPVFTFVLFLKHLWTQIKLFISLREAFFSSSTNINAIAANYLLENKWGCIFDGNNRRTPIACRSGWWLNWTDSVNTDQSDGTVMERWGNGSVTYSVNQPLAVVMLRIAEEFSLQLHGSEGYKCRQLDTVSSTHSLTYSCNILQEVALTSSALETEILLFLFSCDVTKRRFVGCYGSFCMLSITSFGVKKFTGC